MKIKKYALSATLLISFYPAFAQDTVLVSSFNKSEQFESKKDYKSAIDAINKVYDKSSYEINLRLGWLNYENKQYTESESYYTKAIALNPNSIEPRLYFVEPAAALGNANDLLAQYNKVLEINPQNSQVNYWVGMIYYNKKDYQTALTYFERVISLYPFDYSSLLMDAWTKYQLGKTADAKALFYKVLFISANDKSASLGISQIKDASNATLVDEKNIAIIFNQSEDFETNKDYKSAIDVMNKIYDKTSYEMNLRMGWLQYLAGDYAQSESYYKRAIDLMPNAIEPRKGYTYPLAAESKTDELILQHNKILSLDSLNYDANYYMGMIYYTKKDYQTARKYLDKLVVLYPFAYDGLIMDARAKYNLGKMVDAKILFEKVLLMTPTDAEVQTVLSRISNSK
jgi:tetratricopeptide (TPR) repeat protein